MLEYRKGAIPTFAELERLYESVGWSAYTAQPENLVPMLEKSWLTIAAYRMPDGAGQAELVGLVRVVGDGLTIAYIQDLLVLPEHQKHGIGRALIERVMQEVDHIRQVYITTDTHPTNQHVIDFYQQMGFKPVGDWDCITLARF